MVSGKRISKAPSQPIPELAEFLAQFQVQFDRRESQVASERYLTGLLIDHPNKNRDTIASVVPGIRPKSAGPAHHHGVGRNRSQSPTGKRCKAYRPKAMAF